MAKKKILLLSDDLRMASGKPSVNKAWNGFLGFVESVFDEMGNYKMNIEYPKKPSKLCDWCEFKQRNICDGK